MFNRVEQGASLTRIDLVRNATKILVSKLDEGDRFCLVSFDVEVEVLIIPFTDVTPFMKEQWFQQLDDEEFLDPYGATNVEKALKAAVEELFRLRNPRKHAGVLMICDGVPTDGVRDTRELRRILNEILDDRKYHQVMVRFDMIGIGSDADMRYLKLLCEGLGAAGRPCALLSGESEAGLTELAVQLPMTRPKELEIEPITVEFTAPPGVQILKCFPDDEDVEADNRPSFKEMDRVVFVLKSVREASTIPITIDLVIEESSEATDHFVALRYTISGGAPLNLRSQSSEIIVPRHVNPRRSAKEERKLESLNASIAVDKTSFAIARRMLSFAEGLPQQLPRPDLERMTSGLLQEFERTSHKSSCG